MHETMVYDGTFKSKSKSVAFSCSLFLQKKFIIDVWQSP